MPARQLIYIAVTIIFGLLCGNVGGFLEYGSIFYIMLSVSNVTVAGFPGLCKFGKLAKTAIYDILPLILISLLFGSDLIFRVLCGIIKGAVLASAYIFMFTSADKEQNFIVLKCILVYSFIAVTVQ